MQWVCVCPVFVYGSAVLHLVMDNSLGFEACSAGSLPVSPSQREPLCLCQTGCVHSENAPAAQTGGKNSESFGCFCVHTVSSLHTSLQVANCEMRVCLPTSGHVSSHVSGVQSHARILYRGLCFCVHYCRVLYRVQIFISSPARLEASVKAMVYSPLYYLGT